MGLQNKNNRNKAKHHKVQTISIKYYTKCDIIYFEEIIFDESELLIPKTIKRNACYDHKKSIFIYIYIWIIFLKINLILFALIVAN